jgi:hypothetical protein
MAGFEDVKGWVEQHPYATGAIVFVGGLGILWMLGYIGGGSSSNNAANSGAAAFYNAEATQTQAGAAMQIATLQTAAATKQAEIQANAATAIDASNNTASMAIAANGYQAATDQATIWSTAQTEQAKISGQTQRYITNVNDQAAVSMAGYAAQSSALQSQYAYQTAVANNQAQEIQTAMNTIVPQEIAAHAAQGNPWAVVNLPGAGQISVPGGFVNVNDLIGMGYTPQQAYALATG